MVLTLLTISSPMLFGCDQIVDRSLESIEEIRKNKPVLEIEEKVREKFISNAEKKGNDTAEQIKLPQKEVINEDILNASDNGTTENKHDVIGTNKDGPYRSGDINRIRSGR